MYKRVYFWIFFFLISLVFIYFLTLPEQIGQYIYIYNNISSNIYIYIPIMYLQNIYTSVGTTGAVLLVLLLFSLLLIEATATDG